MGAYRSAVLGTSGLVSFWPLDEAGGNALDIKGSNPGEPKNTGITRSQPSLLPNGEGFSTSFTSGLAGYFQIAESASMHVGNSFAIESWFNLASPLGTPGAILGGQTNAFQLWVTSAPWLELDKRAIQNLVISESAKPLSVLTSYHVVANKSGSTRQMIVNGVDMSQLIGESTVENPAGTYAIGKDAGGGTSFPGWLQYVALYSAPLSVATAQAHYTAAFAREPRRSLMGVGR